MDPRQLQDGGDGDRLALIALMITPSIREDNTRMANEIKHLKLDLRRVCRTAREVVAENLTLRDQVAFLESQLGRLVERVHLLESNILDCDDPVHEHARFVRRRLVYDSDDVFEAIDLTTDEIIEE